MKNELQILLRQVWVLTAANLKSRYRNTWSGYLWVILNPLFLYTAQSYVFYFVLRINISNYPLYLALGLLPWIFLVSSNDMSTSSLVVNSRMLKSFPVKPLALVFSQIADNFINYLSAFFVLLIPIGIYTNWPMYNLFYLGLPLLSLFVFVSSFCFLTAQINVFFRDARFILNFLFQVGFFVTPIFYPKVIVPENMKWIVHYNIFYYLIRPFQLLNFDFTLKQYFTELGYSYSVSFAFLLISIYFWRKNRNALYFKF